MAFSPIFQRPFSATFDRRAAAAWSPTDWWTVSGKTVYCAYQAKGAPSLALSYTNLANPGTNNAGVGVAPGWTTGAGWQFSGSQHLTTTFIPALDQSQTVLVQYTNFNLSLYMLLIGSWTGSGSYGRYWLGPAWGAASAIDNGGELFAGTVSAAGNIGFAGNAGYKNGSAVDGSIIAGIVTSTYPMWIGCMNHNGAAENHITAYITALVIYSDTLTAGEVATVSAAMALL